jgi:hypothetical protein
VIRLLSFFAAPAYRGVVNTLSEKIQDIAGLTIAAGFRAIKGVRPVRPNHPEGILLTGTLARDEGRRSSGIDWVDTPGSNTVVARLSRSIGLPGNLPDILGLAVRFTAEGSESDILLASTGPTGLGRFVLRLRRNAASAVFSSMMPYKSKSGPVLLVARTIEGPEMLPATPKGFPESLKGRTWVLELHHATPLGPWTRFGTLTLKVDNEARDTGLRFDPVLHPLPGAGTYGWTRRLREPSYSEARH